MILTRFVLLIAILPYLVQGAKAGAPVFSVRNSTPTSIVVDIAPQLKLISVTNSNGSVATDVFGKELQRVQSADGKHVQYIQSCNVIVPSKTGFEIEFEKVSRTTFTSNQTLAAPVAIPSDVLAMEALPQPLTDPLQITYSGVSTNRYVAVVKVVVAEYKNAVWQQMQSARVKVVFNTIGLDIATTTERAADRLDVINPTAPWKYVRPADKVRKQNEEVLNNPVFEKVFKISISREGIYRITADQLRNVGIPVDAAGAAALRIFSNGGVEKSEEISDALAGLKEQPILVRTNADGSIREVLFYGSGTTGFRQNGTIIEHYINHYGSAAGYLVTSGGTGLRATPAGVGATADKKQLTVVGRVFHDDDNVNPYASGSGRKWLGRNIENGGSVTYTTQLPGFVNSGTVLYRVNVGHRGKIRGLATISESGQKITQLEVQAVPKYMDSFTQTGSGVLDAKSISADGRSVVKIEYNGSDRTTMGLTDWLEIHYPRSLNAIGNSFDFLTDIGLIGTIDYDINGFSSEPMGFDVTDVSAPILLTNAATTGGMFTVRTELSRSFCKRFYISSEVSGTQLEPIVFSNLRSKPQPAKVILITHPSLLTSAKAFAEYRRGFSNVDVTVVTTEEIFNEFGYGITDPTALRDFIATTVNEWTPAAHTIVLWGDGHYDYRGISTTLTNFIPPYESLDQDGVNTGLSTYTADDYFTRVTGDDKIADAAIGRLPIASDAMGMRILAKIREYESSSSTDDWRTRLITVADDAVTTEGYETNYHTRDSESLTGSVLPRDFLVKKIYMVEYPTENIARGRTKPGVTADMLSAVNTTGAVLLNWVGHGNPRILAHEAIFNRETTPAQMTNSNKAFFMTAATCDFARFDMTDAQSGAEELLLKAKGGAIGVFSASRVVFADGNKRINEGFYQRVFTKMSDGSYPDLGDVMFSLKQSFTELNDEKFFLLADPTMRLLLPNYTVVFETINGKSIDSVNTTQLPSLSTVTIQGRIGNPVTSELDTTFNGVATVALLDARRDITFSDPDKPSEIVPFTLPGAALCRGSFVVENGKFTATFVIPKDIAFRQDEAGLYGYAASSDERYAMGHTGGFSVNGIENVEYNDDKGPLMSIYLDSRSFRAGELVRENPILIVDLADDTGLNTAGSSIGHDIEAVFDQGAQIENLTQSFVSSLLNSKSGSCEKQIFGLQPGKHHVRVRSWDVLNNVNEEETTFRISKTATLATEGLQFEPNPFVTNTTIRFTHNIGQAYSVQLRIFDTRGAMVYDRSVELNDLQNVELPWDGTDTTGAQLSSGVYVCVVRVQTQDGSVQNVSGKIVLNR